MINVTDESENLPTTRDENNWGVYAHLAPFVGMFIPFGNVLGPLVIMLTKGKDSEFIYAQACESLNFQITASIAIIVGFMLMIVLIGFLIVPAVAIADIVFMILAAVATSNGKAYHYPMSLRLIK